MKIKQIITYLLLFTLVFAPYISFGSTLTNGMNASYVLGQPDFDSADANYGGGLISDGRGGFILGPS